MKKVLHQLFFVVFASAVLTMLIPASSFAQRYPGQRYQSDDEYVSYDNFYQELAPYGQWIEDPNYGYVWSPDVDGSFRPYYTSGYWAMTEYGNTWVSDFPWGWACFHYGRWIFDQYYGWLWIPGTTWGPAWVCWRYGTGFYGWAPLGPNYDFSQGDYVCPNDWWVFIPPQYVYSGNYYRYWYGPHGNRELVHNTTFVNNVYNNNNVNYVSGPTQPQIELVTHHPVQVYHLDNANSRTTYAHQGVIKMFRPAEIKQQPVDGNRIVPPNVITAPRAINSRPQPVNSQAGTDRNFKNDFHNVNPPTVVPIAVPKQHQQPVNVQNNNVPAHRDDGFPYKTDIVTPEPHLVTPPPDPARQNTPVKPQGPQNPEPVHYEPRQNTIPSHAPQQIETVRPAQQPGGNHPQQAPAQRPEPVRSGKK